jgi:hypothetical protein
MFQMFQNIFIDFFFIFQGHVLDDFSNNTKVADVTKLQNITRCSWMFEGKLMLTLKLSRNTQALGECFGGW